MANDAWYTESGPDNDVVLSTRVRFARDLANFPFPVKFKDDDAQRVRTLVFDSFSHFSDPDCYQAVLTSDLDEMGRQILCERGVLERSTPISDGTGIVIKTDGTISCLVNDNDHVRISSFVAGFDGKKAFDLCKAVDDEMQNSVQFAASYDWGFLTSSLNDCGSGMKVSCRVHLPTLSFTEKIGELFKELSEKNIVIKDCYGVGGLKSSSLGFFYQISTKSAQSGSEIEQMANLLAAVKYLTEQERKCRENILFEKPTEVRDLIYRTYARLKFSFLVPLREAIESISLVKWGKNLGLFSGIEDSELSAMLYRVMEGHLKFVLKTRKINLPADVESDKLLKENYLRGLILQEAFENLKIIA